MRRRPALRAPAGYILHEDSMRVLILHRSKRNPKTGRVWQLTSLLRDVEPSVAVQSGADIWICFACRFRGGRGCYVNLRWVGSVWRAYRRGRYARISWVDAADVVAGSFVRLGAYGEPAGWVPLEGVQVLLSKASGWAGYSHAWSYLAAGWQAFVMASCDTPAEYAEAVSRGWRAFVVVPPAVSSVAGAVRCPSWRGVQCGTCPVRCAGTSSKVTRSVWIRAHGSKVRRVVASIGDAWKGV